MASIPKTFIVEHLDPELGAWSELEYRAIAAEAKEAGDVFILSSLPPGFKVPLALRENTAFTADFWGVEELYAATKSKVCLLDPQADKELSPEDGEMFEAFLFGGILGEPCQPVPCDRDRFHRLTLAALGDDPPRGMPGKNC